MFQFPQNYKSEKQFSTLLIIFDYCNLTYYNCFLFFRSLRNPLINSDPYENWKQLLFFCHFDQINATLMRRKQLFTTNQQINKIPDPKHLTDIVHNYINTHKHSCKTDKTEWLWVCWLSISEDVQICFA